MQFLNYLLNEASKLKNALSSKSQGLEEVFRKIKASQDVEVVQDHVAALRVAEIFSTHTGIRFVFEERWATSTSNVRPHDLVIYADSLRVVNEVRRIREERLGGTKFLKERTTNPLGRIERSTKLQRLLPREFKQAKSSLADLVSLMRDKQIQLEPGVQNILWFVSRNLLFDQEDVRDVVWFENEGHRCRPPDQCDLAYSKLPNLSALGWLFDGDRVSNSCTPHCFILDANQQLKKFLRRSDVCLGKECKDCVPKQHRATGANQSSRNKV